MIYIDNNLDFVMNEEFEKGNAVILQFTSEFCDACMALEMELESIEEQHNDISILSIDVGENETLLDKYGVLQTPTIIIYSKEKMLLHNEEGVILCQDIEMLLGK